MKNLRPGYVCIQLLMLMIAMTFISWIITSGDDTNTITTLAGHSDDTNIKTDPHFATNENQPPIDDVFHPESYKKIAVEVASPVVDDAINELQNLTSLHTESIDKSGRSLAGLIRFLGVGDEARKIIKRNLPDAYKKHISDGDEELTDQKLGELLINTTLAESVSIHGSIWDPVPGYKSHCWVGRWIKLENTKNMDEIHPGLIHPDEVLHCLPYVYMIGVMKSGTTDFYYSLAEHQHVFKAQLKEVNFWNGISFRTVVLDGKARLFDKYIRRYLNVSQHINETTSTSGSITHPGITVDGSILWYDETHRTNVHFSTASVLRYMQPNAKLILMLRNPVDRVFSHFNVGRGLGVKGAYRTSADRFHEFIEQYLAVYQQCISKYNTSYCAVNVDLANSHSLSKNFVRDFAKSFYMLHIHDWLEVFPRDQLLVVISEEYYSNKRLVLNKVAKFIGLDPLNGAAEERLVENSIKNQGRYDEPMYPESRRLLEELFRPFNKELEKILKIKLWS